MSFSEKVTFKLKSHRRFETWNGSKDFQIQIEIFIMSNRRLSVFEDTWSSQIKNDEYYYQKIF